MNRSDIGITILGTGLFVPCIYMHKLTGWYQLSGTEFYYFATANRWMGPSCFSQHNDNRPFFNFEEVLDFIPEDKRIELLFHLDLFS